MPETARTLLVAGATGFVGSRLVEALVARGHRVRAMTRHPDGYSGAGEPVSGDVSPPAGLGAALDGVEVAYYLVHSLGDDDFEHKDAAAADAFGSAAAEAGVTRIVYLGGLGAEDGAALSPHLRSRVDVEGRLAAGGVPVTVLRAAIVIGDGGVSWEITRQLVKNLPAMVTPKWVDTRTQPIALADAVRYLVGVLDRPETTGRVFEIGGPDVLTYGEMLRRAAALHDGRQLPIVSVPVLTPRLSSLWISLFTDVDTTTARNLIDSMSTEVVVHDHAIEDVLPGRLRTYDEAVVEALAERPRRAAIAPTLTTWRCTTADAAATRLEVHLRAALGAPRVPEPVADAAELARRRAVVAAVTVVGAAVLGWSLNVEPGSGWFYAASLLLAAVWTTGAFASGPLHLGRGRSSFPRPGGRSSRRSSSGCARRRVRSRRPRRA